MVFARGLSLGWASPAADLFLAERLWGALSFGDRPFRWTRAHTANLYGRFAIGWCAVLAGYAAFIGVVVVMALATAQGGETEPPAELLIAIYALGVVLRWWWP
jgi:uncharacterized membrane protein YjgN (DUF898 family)